MQLSFSLLTVATTALLLVSAHPAQQLKRVTTTTITTITPSTTTSTVGGAAGIPTHASTVTDALPAALKTTPPSSCGSGPPGAAIKGRVVACPNAW